MITKQIKELLTLISRQEAADFLGCKPSTLALWKCTKRYSLPCVKVGKSVKYRISDLLNFIEKNTQR